MEALRESSNNDVNFSCVGWPDVLLWPDMSPFWVLKMCQGELSKFYWFYSCNAATPISCRRVLSNLCPMTGVIEGIFGRTLKKYPITKIFDTCSRWLIQDTNPWQWTNKTKCTHREGDYHQIRRCLRGPIRGGIDHRKNVRFQPEHIQNCKR